MKKLRRLNFILLILAGLLAWLLFFYSRGRMELGYRKNLKLAQACYEGELYAKSNYYYEKILEKKELSSIYEKMALNYERLEDYQKVEEISLREGLKNRKDLSDSLIKSYGEEEDHEALRTYLKRLKKVDQDLFSHYLEEFKGNYQIKTYGFSQVRLNSLNDKYFIVEKEGAWGVMDEDNKMIVSPIYSWIGDFKSLDRIPVRTKKGLSYVDKEGFKQVKIEGGEDLAGILSNDSYLLKKDGTWANYDFLGRKLSEDYRDMDLIEEDILLLENDGLVARDQLKEKDYSLDYLMAKDGKRSYEDLIVLEDGEKIIYNFENKAYSKRYDQVDLGKVIAVKVKGKWGYIDRDFKDLIQLGYDGAKSSQGQLLPVKKDQTWGLIDLNNNQVVDYNFDDISSLNRRNMAFVKREEGWDKLEFILGDMIE